MIRLRLPPLPETLRRHPSPILTGVRPAVEDCVSSGTLLLERAGIETARLDAECLLAHVLTCPRWLVTLEPRRRLTPQEFGRYLDLLQRREQREPLAYLLGTREFWSLTLTVSPGVLIPRPETETLVEAALGAFRELATPHRGTAAPIIVDLCTGSGAIAIALARELPDARLFATDISRRALRIARANAEAHGIADRMTFLRGDLWRAFTGQAPSDPADMVVGNPPYIPSGLIPTLMPEVQWEPRRALDGGPDGLRVVREIIATTPPRLRAGGFLLLEIGADQAAAVTRLLEVAGHFEACRVLPDLAGRDRVVVARRDPN
jgi:release factor glutamine methyltransferase